MRKVGTMMVEGEGGAKDTKGGINFLVVAAAKDESIAQVNLDKLSGCNLLMS